jgi:hypothetical protein
MKTYDTYIFDKFDYTDGYIYLLPNTILFRVVPKNITSENVIQDKPIYTGPQNIAKLYGENIYKLLTIDSMRLLDIRKITSILSIILNSITPDKINPIEYNEMYIDVMRIMIAFGLTIYPHQLQLFESYNNIMKINPEAEITLNQKINYMKDYKFNGVPHNPVIPMGVRIGEITTDGYVMSILKELFKDICDGYIAPKLVSPFHPGDSAHEEIVIFDPKYKIAVLKAEDKDITINEYQIKDKINNNKNYTVLSVEYKNYISTKINMNLSGGGYLEDKNAFYTDKKYKKLAKEAAKRAKKFVKIINKNIDIKSHIFDAHPHLKFFED